MSYIRTVSELNDAVDRLLDAGEFVFDVETLGKHRGCPRRNRVVWVSLATKGWTGVLPLGHPNGAFKERVFDVLPSGRVSTALTRSHVVWADPPAQLSWLEAHDPLTRLFRSGVVKIGHNLKFDLCSIQKHLGFLPPGPYFDTLEAYHLLDVSRNGSLGLDKATLAEVGYSMAKGVGKNVADHSFAEVLRYSFLDARYTWLLYQSLWPQIRQENLEAVMHLEMDTLGVLAKAETTGAPIDMAALRALDARLRTDLDLAEAEIYKAAGKAFNINSNNEKKIILYGPKDEGNQGLRPKKFTGVKNEPSVDEESLSFYVGKNAVVDRLAEYTELKKLHGTYVLNYLGGENTKYYSGKPKTVTVESMLINGRLHTDFVQFGTETGRLSSRNPNLQNVPNPSTARGKAIRSLFHAPVETGMSLVVADYSQIEPRIMASLSGDPKLCRTFIDGEDIYTALADPFGLPRAGGKVMVLSVGYGTGPNKLASVTGITVTQAKQIIEVDFPKQFPVLMRHKGSVVQEAARSRPCEVRTTLGRRRFLPDLRARDNFLKMRAERQAYNTRIQGEAADIMKTALVAVSAALPPLCDLILTVHDEVVVMCPTERAQEVAEIVRHEMEDSGARFITNLPVKADVKVVQNWGEAK